MTTGLLTLSHDGDKTRKFTNLAYYAYCAPGFLLCSKQCQHFVERPMWRLISSGGEASSVIENYAHPGRVIDVPNGTTQHDNANQLFYVDVVTEF